MLRDKWNTLVLLVDHRTVIRPVCVVSVYLWRRSVRGLQDPVWHHLLRHRYPPGYYSRWVFHYLFQAINYNYMLFARSNFVPDQKLNQGLFNLQLDAFKTELLFGNGNQSGLTSHIKFNVNLKLDRCEKYLLTSVNHI